MDSLDLDELEIGGLYRKIESEGRVYRSVQLVTKKEDGQVWGRNVAPQTWDSSNEYELSDCKYIEVENPDEAFVLRMYDRYDHRWFDVVKDLSLEEAEKALHKKTKGGTKCTTYSDGSYYKIFLANTKMLFS